ncbi:MAG: hypothetical protein E6H57_19955 [Betaproteobacteria bacterium]|nr:MAG: hypothetical protein E6H57_19955 [Betaproteobacteria bacterium]
MRVIDAGGRYVMPGLADMYTHYWDPADSPLYLAHGITTVRSVCVPFQLAMSRVAERGEFPSPRLITISPPVDGVDANGRTDMPRGVAMTDPAQAKGLVERFADYQQIKAFSLLTPENLRALARASSVPVTANCPNAMTFEETVEAGVRSRVLGPVRSRAGNASRLRRHPAPRALPGRAPDLDRADARLPPARRARAERRYARSRAQICLAFRDQGLGSDAHALDPPRAHG